MILESHSSGDLRSAFGESDFGTQEKKRTTPLVHWMIKSDDSIIRWSNLGPWSR